MPNFWAFLSGGTGDHQTRVVRNGGVGADHFLSSKPGVAAGSLTGKGHTAWEGAGGPALPWALGGSGRPCSLIQRHWAQARE